jgi:branched-chain amino acid transport system substrate-binding protein
MPSDSSHHTNDAVRRGGFDRRQFLQTAGAGAAAASLTGCVSNITGGGGGGGGGGGEGPIRIGAVYLLSGLAEALGASSEASAQLAVDTVNEDDGINGRDVEIIFRDHGDNPGNTITSLVQEDNVDAMIGLTSSGVTLTTAPTIEQLGVPMVLTDIGTPYITEPNYDEYGNYYQSDSGTAAGKSNIFRTNANTTINTYGQAKWAQENLDVTRVANIGPNYAYGEQCWDYFKAFSDGLGADYEYVESVFPELGASNMTPQINQVLAADPDLVFTSFWASDTVTFVQQATEQGLFEQVDDVFDTLGADPTSFQALGSSMPEGYHFSGWYWHSAFDNQSNSSMLEAYRNEYAEGSGTPGVPSIAGGSAWAAVFMYKKAMEAIGGTSAEDIIGELEGMSFGEDPRGSITIDSDSHQANAPAIIGETSMDDDVPYDGVGLTNTETYTLDRETATELLSGTDLAPGV